MNFIKDESGHKCYKYKCEGVVSRIVYHDNWMVEHCNTCNYWDAGFVGGRC